MSNILTTSEEKLLAQFVCRLSISVGVEAYAAALPDILDNEKKEELAMNALKNALPAINKLSRLVYKD